MLHCIASHLLRKRSVSIKSAFHSYEYPWTATVLRWWQLQEAAFDCHDQNGSCVTNSVQGKMLSGMPGNGVAYQMSVDSQQKQCSSFCSQNSKCYCL